MIHTYRYGFPHRSISTDYACTMGRLLFGHTEYVQGMALPAISARGKTKAQIVKELGSKAYVASAALLG